MSYVLSYVGRVYSSVVIYFAIIILIHTAPAHLSAQFHLHYSRINFVLLSSGKLAT